jgi:hypothetical protein
MQLVRKRLGKRLSARLAALAVSDEQRRAVAFAGPACGFAALPCSAEMQGWVWGSV